MLITINSIANKKRDFNVDNNVLISDLKQIVAEKEGISTQQFRLLVNGRAMNDKDTLNKYNIAAGTVINMILILRGGCN